MSATVKYKGNTIATLTENETKTLTTQGKYVEGNIIIENVKESAKEPYIEETHSSPGTIIKMTLHGYTVLPSYFAYSRIRLTTVDGLENVTSFVNTGYQFYACERLKNIVLPDNITSMPPSAFQGCAALTTAPIPAQCQTINSSVYRNCTSLTTLTLPSQINYVGGYAFGGCTALTTVTFTSKPTTLIVSAFNGCTAVTTINVPWSQGEVAGAPWGATNATVNYNYTGG